MIELTQENFIANAIQGIKDLINGGLTHRNMKTFRTFFVVNAMDSLDSDVPMYVPFAIPASTAEVVEVRVSFWLLPFRAYSKAAASGGGSTSGASSVSTTPSGGGITSGSSSSETTDNIAGLSGSYCYIDGTYPDAYYKYNSTGETYFVLTASSVSTLSNHVHGMQHNHTCPNHQHNIEHTHTTPNHSHDIVFGIYEEDNSPSVTLYVSRDGGATYPTRVGTYSTDQVGIEITSYVDTPGSKMLKFESTDLGRLSAQIEIKVDMSR